MASLNNAVLLKIRNVWEGNLGEEFDLIRKFIDDFPFVSMDTEFPGVFNSRRKWERVSNYSIVKRNVDATKLIQLGLTLTDSEGNVPLHPGPTKDGCIWQFNFREFDVSRDTQALNSVNFLRAHGMDFKKNSEEGIDCVHFVELLMSSGLVCNVDWVTWVTFHCAYDFAHLIKVITQEPLPTELNDFMILLRVYFGKRVFDVKCMIMLRDDLFGGLDTLAKTLGLEREVGRSHQAGSDSLLTWRVFHTISQEGGERGRFAGLLYGLEGP